MPTKRLVEIRIEEAKELLARLQDEKRLQELRERIRQRRRRRR